MADVQTGFGSFVSFYLADQGWSEENVGFVLTAGGLSGVVGQIPGGALVDAMRRKKLLIAIGTLMIAASAVLLALSRDFPAVFAAEVLHGATGAIIGPAIAAVSLGLFGGPRDVRQDRPQPTFQCGRKRANRCVIGRYRKLRF